MGACFLTGSVGDWTREEKAAYDRWKEPPEEKKKAYEWVLGKRRKKKLIEVTDEDYEIMNADDRYDAEKNGDY